MAPIFPDAGIFVTDTGSIGLEFDANNEPLPSDITVTATDGTNTFTFPALDIISSPGDDWQLVELTTPIPLGRTYDIEVLFDAEQVFVDSVAIPAPGRRRARVLRQRIYEVLLAGYRTAPGVNVQPYGDGHVPMSVGSEINAFDSCMVEVGVAYPSAIGLRDINTRMSVITIPLNVYHSMDDPDDPEGAARAAEDVADYLLSTDWKMNSFGLFQSQATFDFSAPEIGDDGKISVCRGNLTITMSRGSIK